MEVKQFKILSHVYDIIYHSNWDEINREEDARIIFDKQRIIISGLSARRDMLLCHEIVHAISQHFTVPMTEEDVQRFGQGLFHVLIENKELLSNLKTALPIPPKESNDNTN